MATIKENAQRIKAAADDIREVIDLCYAEVGEDERIEDYAPKLARLAVDEPTPEVIGIAPRVTAGGRMISDSISSVRRIYGETIVWNQSSDWSKRGIKPSSNSFQLLRLIPILPSRKYLFVCIAVSYNSNGNNKRLKYYSEDGSVAGNLYWSNDNETQTLSKFFTPSSETTYMIEIWSNESYGVISGVTTYDAIGLHFDLTKMFGSGKEPNTIDDFTQRIFGVNSGELTYEDWENIASQSEPVLVNSSPKSIVSKSRNLLDEEFELGEINSETGLNSASTSNIRTKNYIKVKPNTKYFFCCEPLLAVSPRARFYDENKNYIGYSCKDFVYVPSNRAFTTSDNAHYVRFAINVTNYGSNTYRNDICLNESDSDDGKYTPYFESTLEINPKSIRDENGERVFPEGLLSAGSVHDEIDCERGVAVKRVANADLGSLDWARGSYVFYTRTITPISSNLICDKFEVSSPNSSSSMPEQSVAADIANKRFFFKKSDLQTNDEIKDFLAGSYIHYEISPIEYPLPASWRKSWMRVANGGTERITADGMTLPLHADIAYRTANAVALANDLSNANNIL